MLFRSRMKIPVMHDDQHGTAIVVGAAATNALRVVGKKFEDIKIVLSRRDVYALALDMKREAE